MTLSGQLLLVVILFSWTYRRANSKLLQRTSKGYDTLLQMGRWFGYEIVILTLLEFSLPQKCTPISSFTTVEEEIREDIEQMAINGEDQ